MISLGRAVVPAVMIGRRKPRGEIRMRSIAVAFTALLFTFPALTARAADDTQTDKERKKIVFLAGRASHGFGAHDHLAGCHLLANKLKEAQPARSVERRVGNE